MKKGWLNTISRLTLCALLWLPLPAFSAPLAQIKAAAQAPPKKADTATPAPSAQEIANARTKGLVWVNLGTGVYHKDGEFYGKTKRGKFMSEADAQKGGYRAAKSPTASKKSATPKVDTKQKK